jgi:hypothetical protein
MKTISSVLCIAQFCYALGFAQQAVVKGRVVDMNSFKGIPDVEVRIEASNFITKSDTEGLFQISGTHLPQGEQILLVQASDYYHQRIRITIQHGKTINLEPLLLEIDVSQIESEIGLISLDEAELDEEDGSSAVISGILQATNDVFLSAAAYDFSAAFFRPRGLDNSYEKILINGIEMNKQYSGRPQWANWGGMNDVQRLRVHSTGIANNEYSFGGLRGTTNLIMRASKYRKGARLSFATTNRSYLGRVMGSYHSGVSLKGWSYSVLISRRFGNQGYKNGTLYEANSFFVSAEKKLTEKHSVNITGFYTPNRRGRAAPMTQEVKELKGIRYNPNWGYQDGVLRNSRIRSVEEPIVMLNHFWNLAARTTLNTNLGYQIGKVGNTRLDYGGTRLQSIGVREIYIGGARNPFGDYYQRQPSYFLRMENPTAYDYQLAYLAEQEFLNDGQLNWNALYYANELSKAKGGNSIYIIQEDRTDDTQITLNTILNTQISEKVRLDASLNFRNLSSENFAVVKDLLGGTGYLDVDYFAEGESNDVIVEVAQSDLQNRNRLVTEGGRYKYDYLLSATVTSGFAQSTFAFRKVDFFISAVASQTQYQRNGEFENGHFPRAWSLGTSEKLNFTNLGVKAGLTYKPSGRHLIDLNAGYSTKAPSLRNSFSNPRQNNDIVIGLDSEKIQQLEVGYIFRSPLVKSRVTGYYTGISGKTDISFFFTESARGKENGSAFLQEIITGMNTQSVGGELGIEAQVTPTFKLKAAASIGQHIYINNPNYYLTSEDFMDAQNVDGIENNILIMGDGITQFKNYHVPSGPERAFQIGFEYRSPEFWWIGVTANYFSNSYIDISALRRSSGFSTDYIGQPFNDYDEEVARSLLQQEEFDAYYLVNLVGGKSWKINQYYLGFFASIQNALSQEYITGGFENSRYADYRKVLQEYNRERPVFGGRYFFGNGTTYYVNLYIRF